MDMGTLRGIATALALIAFIGVVLWAFSRRRREDFRSAARLPLEEDDVPPARKETGR